MWPYPGQWAAHALLWKEEAKTFLPKMMIVREHVGQPCTAHGLHRDAIRQTVCFVGAGFIQRQAVEKRGMRLGNDGNMRIGEHPARKQDSAATCFGRPTTAKIQKFSQHLLGGIEMTGCEGPIKGLDALMPLIPSIGEGNPIERIHKKPVHGERLGQP